MSNINQSQGSMDETVPEAYGEALWLIFYDVQSENSKNLKPDEQDWLRSQRVEIWYALRYLYKCVPLQHSVWLIRGENTEVVLEKRRQEWLSQYSQHNFTAHIEIFPVKTTDAGYKSFKHMEFEFIVEWLGKIEKALTKAIDSGKIGKKNVQAHKKKIELLGKVLSEDFDETSPNWKLAQDNLGIVQDLLHTVEVATGANITNL